MTAIGRAPWPLDALAEIAKVLESLGHAATQQNANSSRFGKFLRLHVTRCLKKPRLPRVGTCEERHRSGDQHLPAGSEQGGLRS